MMITICFSDSTRRWRLNISLIRENCLSHSNIRYSYDSSSVDEFFYTRVKINMMNVCNESTKVLSNQSLCILSDFPRVDLHKMSFLCCLLIEIVLNPTILHFRVITSSGLGVISQFWVVLTKKKHFIHLKSVGNINDLKRIKLQILFLKTVWKNGISVSYSNHGG